MPDNKATLQDLHKVLQEDKGGVNPPSPVSKDFIGIDGFVDKNIDVISNVGIWDAETYEKYRDYDVTLTNRKTEEELNKERAKNQGAIEQLGNFAVQAIGNEVVLGTFLGLSNLVDSAISLFDDKGENDYTNPFSSWLEGLQDEVRERYEIYRENPNETFDISDFGWWADNAVSIASTASMLIPTFGVARGLSLAGKGARLGIKALGKGTKLEKTANALANAKLSRGVAKAISKTGLTKNTASLAKSIDIGADISKNALMSRVMENYQEARGVYQEVYNSTLEKINKMTNEERATFFKNNPNFEGKNNEEIASYIASVSGDETFRNDFAMLIFDIAQFKAIGSLWKGMTNKAVTGALRNANRNAINNLVQTEQKAATKLGFLQKRLDNFKYAINNPLKSVAAIEWSEGLEEGYQGIQTEKGKEVAQQYLDPKFSARSIDDYLTDSAIWEQAFWGVLGGIGFQAAGKGLGHLAKKVKGEFKKNKLTDEEIALSKLSDEKIREKEIETRQQTMQEYVDKIQLINEGYNPFDYKVDEAGEPILQDGNKIFGAIKSEAETDLLKESITNDFVTNLTLNATDVGNYELLKEFVTNPNFNKFFQEAGIDNNILTQSLVQKMDNAYENYSQALNDIYTNANVENENVAKAAARDITRKRLRLNEIQEHINNIENTINEDKDVQTVTSEYENFIRSEYAKERLQNLEDLETAYISANASGQMNDITFNIVKDRINKQRKAIIDEVKRTTPFGELEDIKNIIGNTVSDIELSKFLNTFNSYYKQINKPTEDTTPKQELQNLVFDKIANEINLYEIEALIPKDAKGYNELYQDVARELDKATIDRYNQAVDNINKYLEDAEDIKIAQQNLLEGNVNAQLKEDLDIIKIGSKNTNKYISLINAASNIAQNDRIKKEEEARTIEEDGKPINTEKAEAIKEEVEEIVSSTGEEIEVETAEVADVVNIENPVEFVPVTEVENIIEQIDPVLIEQAKIDEANFILNTDDRAALFAQDVVIGLFRSSPATLQSITSVDESDANFNKVVDYVTEQIILKGISSGIARQAAKNGIKLAFDVRAIAMRNRNPDEASKFKKLSAEIAIRSTIKVDRNNAAITTLLSDKEFNKVVNDFMESYIKSNNITPNKNGVYYIDVLNLFDTLLNKDNSQSYDTVRHIFRNLKDYILNFRDPKLKFINTKILNQHLNNPETFIAALIEAKTTTKNVDRYMHIKPATKKSSEYSSVIRSLTNNSLVDITDTGNSIDISKDGIQIGYITKVKAGKDNNSYKLIQQDKGFVWEVSENIDKTIKSNMDNLFTEIINQDTQSGKDIYEAIQRVREINTNTKSDSSITGADWNTLIANFEFKRLYENGDIKIPNNNKTNAQKATYVLNNISNIVFYDNTLNNKEDILFSYNEWKYNIYNNYNNTNKIQNKLKENKSKLTIKIAGIKSGKLKYSNINRNINELGFVGTNNPMVAVLENGSIISESSNKTYINTAGFRPYAMGYLVNDNPNAPMIALVTETNNLIDNSQLTNDVYNELNTLFNNFLNNDIDISEIGQSLQDLLGSYGSNNHNNLFSGYSVIRDKGSNFVALNINNKLSEDNGKYALIINKDGSIIHIKNGNTKVSTKITKYDNNTISKVIDDIISPLTFNKTFFSIRNNTNSNTNNNKYIYKREGKLHVNIGGNETVYDNFSDFTIKNNTFKTNQGGNAISGYYDVDSSISSLYINVDTISSPVERDVANIDKQSATTIIRSANKEHPVNTRDVLRSAGYSNEYIDAILGKNEFNIPIVDESIYYDAKATKAEAYYEDNKLFITNKGSGRESIDRPLNLLRLIVHESIHKRVANEGLFEGKEHLVDELMNTYNVFVEALSKDNSENAIAIKTWLNEHSFTPNEYFTNLPANEAKKWSNRTEEERKRYFAEEWLAESLSQPIIVQYLNRTKYDGAIISNINDENKTIWQKIIDILIKLFDKYIGSIKDNTILAQQYSILGNEYNANNIIKNDTDVVEDTNFREETQSTERKATKKREKRDREYAVTDMIGNPDEIYADAYAADNSVNPTGIQVVPDMNTYTDQFSEHEKPLIANMIRNNEIKFKCE